MNYINKDRRFHLLYMDIALRVAMESKATRLKVGAVMVNNGQMVIGYNGTPSGWDNTCENELNKTKPEVLHAESNLASKVMQSSISSKGSTVYVTHSCCIDCAKLMYQAGVETIVYKTDYKSNDGIDFLKKCGVNVIKLENENETIN